MPLQDEEELLVAVDDYQHKLVELNNQLLLKKTQMTASKVELDQKNQSVEEQNK